MRAAIATLLLAPLALAGCATPEPQAAGLLRPRSGAAAATQERSFEGLRGDEMQLAVVTLLQDLGFQVTASEPSLGLIVGTRGHAGTAGEYAARFRDYMGAGMKNFFTFRWSRYPNPERYVGPTGTSAVVSITPSGSAIVVRLSLHHFVRKPTGEAIVVWAEEIPGPEAHRDFFALLARALDR